MHKEHARSGVDIGLIREHVWYGKTNGNRVCEFQIIESVSVIRGKYEEYKS